MNPTYVKATRVAFALLAIGFFAAPIALRALGVTAEAFENRRFAEAPKPSQGWNAFQQTSQFLIDRMPLRAEAVRANTRIWQDIFDTTPRYGGSPTALGGDEALPFAGATEAEPATDVPTTASQVIEGEDRWLFLAGELTNACTSPLPLDEALRRWADLVATVRDSGRRALLLVAPDKASVYPEFLPGDVAGGACARKRKRAFWELLERRGPALGVVSLRQPLLRAKRTAGDLVYLRRDSHWNAIGALAPVRAILDRFGGGVRIKPDEVVMGSPSEYRGDLTTLLGATDTDTEPEVDIQRAADAARVPGRVLLLGDSFGTVTVSKALPYFEAFRFALWTGVSGSRLLDEISRADTVVFETVEREFAQRVIDGGIAGPALVEQLRLRLTRR